MLSAFRALFLLKEISRYSRLGRKGVLAFQTKQLRYLIEHSYRNVPYYRRLFNQAGIKPSDIKKVEDIALIPVTSKKDFQGLPVRQVVSEGVDPERLIAHKTSGSTGQPSVIRRTPLEEHFQNFLRWRAGLSMGRRISDKLVIIRSPRRKSPGDWNLPDRIAKKMGLYRVERIDCTRSPRDIIMELRRIRPDIINGLSGTLSRLTDFMDEEDLKFLRPRLIEPGGEVLTEEMKKKISTCFSAPVFEIYGSFEFGLIAWECGETGELHTSDEGLIVEVLKDGEPAGPGERGEVVVTNLFSFAMPFIRFNLGDMATKGENTCVCGRPYSTLKGIEGRRIDYFRFPGGRLLHPYYIVKNVIRDQQSWISQFQIVQEREDRVVLKIVPLTRPSEKIITGIDEKMRSVLGEDIESEVLVVPEIVKGPGEKNRPCLSLVASHYDEGPFKISS